MPSSYYDDKLETLTDLFGTKAQIDRGCLRLADASYPIVDDVIVLLPPERRPVSLRPASVADRRSPIGDERASDLVQASFGAEWNVYADVLPEHRDEFVSLFDLVDLGSLHGARVADLGCGIGRWSHFVAPHCRELVLVDFSDAIFVARRNLAGVKNALFFLGDVTVLPFRRDFADFAFCIGVLHHLPTPALDAVRSLAACAPRLLIYLYYALDNRAWYFRTLLRAADVLRHRLSRIRDPRIRRLTARLTAVAIYKPLIGFGHVLDLVGWGRFVPLFEYRGKSLRRIEQDTYERFFNDIEQRVSRAEIVERLSPSFPRLTISERAPYWHFLCERTAAPPSAAAEVHRQ